MFRLEYNNIVLAEQNVCSVVDSELLIVSNFESTNSPVLLVSFLTGSCACKVDNTIDL